MESWVEVVVSLGSKRKYVPNPSDNSWLLAMQLQPRGDQTSVDKQKIIIYSKATNYDDAVEGQTKVHLSIRIKGYGKIKQSYVRNMLEIILEIHYVNMVIQICHKIKKIIHVYFSITVFSISKIMFRRCWAQNTEYGFL